MDTIDHIRHEDMKLFKEHLEHMLLHRGQVPDRDINSDYILGYNNCLRELILQLEIRVGGN